MRREFYSATEAARTLGIDRKTTLRDLIDTGAIHTVRSPKGARVPRSEIERLITQGAIPRPGDARGPRRRRSPRRPPPADVAAAIRRIPVR